MRPRQLPQTPQDCSTNHILHVSHGGNLYMSHPSQPTATSIPLATPSARVYSSLTPNYTPLLHVYSPKLLFHCTKNDASMTRLYCPLAAQPLKQIIRYILRLLPRKLNGYKKYWTNWWRSGKCLCTINKRRGSALHKNWMLWLRLLTMWWNGHYASSYATYLNWQTTMAQTSIDHLNTPL